MQHTIGKLAALALVVGVGVAVVIHAQRTIQSDDPGVNSTDVADYDDDARPLDENDGTDADLSAPDDDTVGYDKRLLSDKTTSKSPRKNAAVKDIVKTSGGRTEDALALDEADDELVDIRTRRSGVSIDPSADSDDDELELPPNRSAARPSRSRDDLRDLVDDAAPTDQNLKARTAAKSKPIGGSRGAVLNLDDSESDELEPTARIPAKKSKPSAGPRLAAGTDEPPEDLSDGAPPAANPLLDDDSAEPQDDDADLNSGVEENTPRALLGNDSPKPTNARSRQPADADESTEPIMPRIRSGAERQRPATEFEEGTPRATPRLDSSPAELGTSIEIDDPPTAPTARPGPSPRIKIEKQAPKAAVLGKPMVYHIYVRNVGSIPAHQVIVEDVIPPEFEIDGSIPQAFLKDDRLIWKLGTLPAGKDKKIAVRVIPRVEGTIGGVATVNFAADNEPPRKQKAKLQIDVRAPKQAAVGTPVEFNFHIENVGQIPARSVTIRDVLPAGLRHPDGDDLEFNMGDLLAGTSQDVKLVLTAAQAGPTTNRVVVTADGDVAEETEVQLDVLGPMLQVARNGPKRMIPGKIGNFSNTVTNPGTKEMTDVTVIEKVPPGMEYVSAGEGGVYDETKRSVFWSLKRMQPGDSRTVTIALKTASRGAQISVIRAFDAFGTSGETSTTTKVTGAPALSIELAEVPAVVEPGETVRIPVRVVNRGSDAASHVRLTMSVPRQLKVISAEGPTDYHERKPESPDGESVGSGELHYAPIDKLDPKGDAIFEITVKAAAIGSANFELRATCDELPDPIRRQEVISIVND
jgi:uncharacterized repeat protein (TIGR01451 family)